MKHNNADVIIVCWIGDNWAKNWGEYVCKSVITLYNVPPLEDTYAMIEIMKYLNVIVLYDNKDKEIYRSSR